MRLRLGFVSNSSSSSFVVHTAKLDSLQVSRIIDYMEEARTWVRICKQSGDDRYDTDISDIVDWDIRVTDSLIYFSTEMDNFDMYFFLTQVIGIPPEVIVFDE